MKIAQALEGLKLKIQELEASGATYIGLAYFYELPDGNLISYSVGTPPHTPKDFAEILASDANMLRK